MYPKERQKQILDLLTEQDMMKLTDLSTHLEVSMETVRRDIQALVVQKKIEKFYGGIKLAATSEQESLIAARMQEHIDEKEKIARVAVQYIEEGDTIFLDSGSTTYPLAKYIKGRQKLTVVTNSLPIVNELIDSEVDVLLIGGKLRHSEKSITAYDMLFQFDYLNIQKAFICTSGISLENGLSDYDIDEIRTRRQIMKNSKQTYVLCDHSKFGRDVTIKTCHLAQIDGIMTDDGLEDAIRQQFIDAGHTLIVGS